MQSLVTFVDKCKKRSDFPKDYLFSIINSLIFYFLKWRFFCLILFLNFTFCFDIDLPHGTNEINLQRMIENMIIISFAQRNQACSCFNFNFILLVIFKMKQNCIKYLV